MMVGEDRQKQSLKEGKAHTACSAGSNASTGLTRIGFSLCVHAMKSP
jgi:hypothetical protein